MNAMKILGSKAAGPALVLAGLLSPGVAGAQALPEQPVAQAQPAQAQPAQPVVQAQPAQAQGMPDVLLRAALERQAVLQLIDGSYSSGRIVAVDAENVALALADGRLVVVQRSTIARVQLVPQAPAAPTYAAVAPEDAPPGPPPKPRHFAINLGLPPSLNLDLDVGLFHGFANASLVFPAVSDGDWMGFSIGGGVGIPVAPRRPALKLDVVAYLAPFSHRESSHYDYNTGHTISGYRTSLAAGLGVGLHYTWSTGFTLGFTAPILGYAWAVGTVDSSYTGVVGFFLASAVGLPLGYLGYRF